MADNSPSANPLSAASLSHYMLASLSPTASPQLKNAWDALALGAHASLLSVGFRLIGLGEDHRIEATSDATQPQPLPTEWNAGNGSYSFRYAHSQSSMEFLLKINRMANKAIIMGMGIGDDRTCSFDVTTRDYISDGNLPATPLADGRSEDEAKKAITDVFISAGRLSDFGSSMRLNVIQKLIPGLHKAGYEETREGQSSSQQQRRQQRDPPPEFDAPRHNPLREDRDPPARPHPLHDPLAIPPRRPMPEPMPGFEDEYETLRPPRRGMMPGQGMPRLGDRDLYPQGLGPRDPLYGGVGPGFGGVGGGGMHPTFDDPLFARQGQRGDEYDPQAPPGSRYDPVGPGMGHPRGAGMGGRPPNPFGGFGDGDFI
ncbi:PI31 proteasome regulator N-terminal-domain-containing protein [Neohortaea acidophila]|uniref:PI31 proteasome regulator N-terminal-domain-containing protein n=1 Tax=Neohortaea acidophila TaxID=245834 RepID=A0A6A6Q6Y4_9PEZI|nr:PI31 proteasome regulator N-terminal-domain-containing protein [Neohortaea acidophila]KAF2488208.1 PI31 proteasome regulator N-terminal-domain-containing protein [Neohortaea acidophila]